MSANAQVQATEREAGGSTATPCWTTRSATNPTDGDAP